MNERIKYLETHLEIVRYFSQSILRSNNVDDILWDIASNCIEKLNFEDCIIYIVDTGRNVLTQKAAYGEKVLDNNEIACPIEIPIGKGIVGTVAKTGVAEIVNDCSIDYRYIVDDVARLSEICVPIIYENKVIALIDSENKNKGFYTQEHLDILTSIATISATKIAKIVAEEKNEVFARFVQENPNPVMRLDRNGVILNKNRASKELLKYWSKKKEEITNVKALNIIKLALKKRERQTLKVFYKTKTINLIFVPISGRDYINIYASDITELENAKREAENANKAKDNFLSVMSHEIRTPLNAIIGITNILKAESSNEKQKMHLETLDSSSQNLLKLVKDILDLEKIKAEKIALEKINFNLKKVLDNLYYAFLPESMEQGNKLILEIAEDVPTLLIGDPLKLNQILNNILSNAIKFTKKGNIKLSVTQKKTTKNSTLLYFRITDSGIGIPKDKQRIIFNAFEQAENSTTRKYGGTGLGLSITKQLLELQGGKIEVDSSPNIGTTFTAQIPFLLANKSENHFVEQTMEFNNETLKGIKILLVDDNPVNLLIGKQFLKRWGCDVVVAQNGNQAFTSFENENPDLILMDLRMPECDGFEASKKIRNSENKNKNVPIIAFTADLTHRSQNHAISVGINGILSKPFIPNEMLLKIKSHLPIEVV